MGSPGEGIHYLGDLIDYRVTVFNYLGFVFDYPVFVLHYLG